MTVNFTGWGKTGFPSFEFLTFLQLETGKSRALSILFKIDWRVGKGIFPGVNLLKKQEFKQVYLIQLLVFWEVGAKKQAQNRKIFRNIDVMVLKKW